MVHLFQQYSILSINPSLLFFCFDSFLGKSRCLEFRRIVHGVGWVGVDQGMGPGETGVMDGE